MAAKALDLGKAAKERLERERIEQLYATVRLCIKWLGIVVVAWQIRCAIGALAGQNTSVMVNAVLSLLGNIQFTAAISLAGAATVWAICERALRHRKVEKMQGRIRELETQIDPKRTSSGLLTTGKTNPSDKWRS